MDDEAPGQKRARASKAEHAETVRLACVNAGTRGIVDGHFDGCTRTEKCPSEALCKRCRAMRRGCCFLTVAAAKAVTEGELTLDDIPETLTNATCLQCSLIKAFTNKRSRTASGSAPAGSSASASTPATSAEASDLSVATDPTDMQQVGFLP